MLVYVDDIILFNSFVSAADRLVGENFVVKDLGRLVLLLGGYSLCCWVDSHSADILFGAAASCKYAQVQNCYYSYVCYLETYCSG
jgi:hypothetical protein